jgi:hypothetical protein
MVLVSINSTISYLGRRELAILSHFGVFSNR